MPTILVVLGHIWASPWTVLGYLVAVLGGARWVGWDNLGVAVFANANRGLVGLYFRRLPMLAYTCGAVVVVLRPTVAGSARTMGHELRHVLQMFVLGPIMPLAYVVASLVATAGGGNAYRDNVFEVDARRAGDLAAESAAAAE